MVDVSVIYVNYKTKNLVLESIKSLKEKTDGVNYEIIVVDNNSDDGIKESLSSDIIFVQAGENLGFGQANNLGAKHASGKYLFLLNGDTLLMNNALKTLFDYMQENSSCGVCGGNLFTIDEKPTYSYLLKMPSPRMMFWKAILPHSVFYKLNSKNYVFNHSEKPLKVGYITGADFMTRKNVYDAVGGFDKDFFMYCEESELCNRINKAGYSIVSVPQAKIIHLEGASTKIENEDKVFNERKFRMMETDSQFMFFNKVYGKKAVKKYYRITKFKFQLRKNKVGGFYKEKLSIFKKAYEEWLNKNK